MKKVKLIDVCDFQGGSQPPKDEWSYEQQDGYIRMLQIRDFTQTRDFVEEYIKISASTKTCEKDDILIARYGASIGKILTGLSGAYNVAIMKTIPDENILKKSYLKYYLLSDYFQNRIKNVGSRAAQAGFNKSELKELFIPLRSFEEQEKIICELDSIENVIQYHNELIDVHDKTIKARFVEMFGEPFLNPKEWETAKIGDIVTEVRYGTSRPATEGGKYPYLRMNNLTFDGHLDLTDLKYIDIPDNEIEKCIVRKGDVLFNRTNSVELVGKTSVFNLDEEMVIAGYIIRVRLNEKILPTFLSAYMNSAILKEHLRGMAKGAVNQANINAQELQGIKIYIPPFELQQQFANFVEQVEKAKQVIKEQLEELETLKKSLMQKYFG